MMESLTLQRQRGRERERGVSIFALLLPLLYSGHLFLAFGWDIKDPGMDSSLRWVGKAGEQHGTGIRERTDH